MKVGTYRCIPEAVLNEPEIKLRDSAEVPARVARSPGGHARSCLRRQAGREQSICVQCNAHSRERGSGAARQQWDQVQGDGGRELSGRSPASPVEPLPITDHRHVGWCDLRNETFIRNGAVCVRGQ